MIYTVECSYSDSASEEQWNDFYSLHKLPALISVRGFHTSQRFRACGAACPTYLALHSIDGMEVLQGTSMPGREGQLRTLAAAHHRLASQPIQWLGSGPRRRTGRLPTGESRRP